MELFTQLFGDLLAFVYSDHDTGRVATILGYPTDKLSQIA